MARHLQDLFRLYAVDVVIDVGANRGQYRDFLRERVGFQGRVHSFEPITQLRDFLRTRAAADTRWEVHGCALGSEETTLQLQIMNRDSFSSFRAVDQNMPESFRGSTQVERTESVPVRRLENVAPALAGVPSGTIYLKVDTQGFDLEVLKGAGSLLGRIAALQFELPVQRIYRDVPSYRDLLEVIETMGFELSGLFPVSTDDALRAVEFDCVMVRRDATHLKATGSEEAGGLAR